jgi:hypothetical protein
MALAAGLSGIVVECWPRGKFSKRPLDGVSAVGVFAFVLDVRSEFALAAG